MEHHQVRLPARSIQDSLIQGDGILPPTEGFRWHTLPAYDLIVIGGGINGTGIARDAALRGLKVLLLEKNDFGSGTSAYSSRLIHGGLRYLENLELDLVYESLAERERLLKNAPHLVRPLAMGIPIYKGSRTPMLTVGIGMLLYDFLSVRKSLPWHKLYGPRQFQDWFPGVAAEQLQGGPIYFDAQVDFPELICVENVIAAQETGNASLINHAPVTGFIHKKNSVGGVYFEDALSGQAYVASGRVIVNAAGPWLDDILSSASTNCTEKPAPRIGGTKGSHIVVNRLAGASEHALYVEAQSDGRPFFIIPWRERFCLIGTTDIHFSGQPDTVAATRAEVDYLLTETNRVLPQARLTVEDVLYTYSGIRPLPNGSPDEKGLRKAGKITRKHWIEDHGKSNGGQLSGLISVIGGKLTTYRNLAEKTVNYAVKHYGLTVSGTQPNPTLQTPLPGGVGLLDVESFKQKVVPGAANAFDLPEATVSHWIDLYGSRYDRVLQLTKENPVWKEPLHPGGLDRLAQVVYAVRHQFAVTLSDVMLRRIGCGLDADAGLGCMAIVARCMGAELGWPESKVKAELAAYRHFIEQRHLAYRQESVEEKSPVASS